MTKSQTRKLHLFNLFLLDINCFELSELEDILVGCYVNSQDIQKSGLAALLSAVAWRVIRPSPANCYLLLTNCTAHKAISSFSREQHPASHCAASLPARKVLGFRQVRSCQDILSAPELGNSLVKILSSITKV